MGAEDDVGFFGGCGDVFDLVVGVEGGESEGDVAEGGDCGAEDSGSRSLDVLVGHVIAFHFGEQVGPMSLFINWDGFLCGWV